MMSRRMFSTSILAGAAALLLPAAARSQNSVKARNIVLVQAPTPTAQAGWKSYPTYKPLG